jgi:endonuclease V-like protein UPF0215 family
MKKYLRYIDVEKDYSKLKEPTLSAMKFRDNLIGKSFKENLSREDLQLKILEKTHNIMANYDTKIFDLQCDLDRALDIISDLCLDYNKISIKDGENFQDEMCNKYLK